MPQKSPSGTTGLSKLHTVACRAQSQNKRITACQCPWFGRYRDEVVQLARWSRSTVDPTTLDTARVVFTRMKKAIDDGVFDREGERSTAASKGTFAAYIDQWWEEHVVEHGLAQGSLKSVVGVVKDGDLGRTKLHDLTHKQIAEWLSEMRKKRSWGKKNYNEYLALVKQRLLQRAVEMGILKSNPAIALKPLPGVVDQRGELRHWRITPDIEARLFDACDKLNRTYGPSTSRLKLTQEKADAIRKKAKKKGVQQKDLAAEYKVSQTVVSQILSGRIWNPAERTTTTKGDEMRRRLIGGLDMGPRAGEMEAALVGHVEWNTPKVLIDPATKKPFNGYRIALPPAITKGGKWSGETEYLYAGTPRCAKMLEDRRAQLKGRSDAFLFGTEDGTQVKSFRKSWQALFAFAGLEWGRKIGVTWHKTRHEFTSRLAKKHGAVIAKKLARHQQLATTERYIHPTNDDAWDAASDL